jgi:hypothetical protein
VGEALIGLGQAAEGMSYLDAALAMMLLRAGQLAGVTHRLGERA